MSFVRHISLAPNPAEALFCSVFLSEASLKKSRLRTYIFQTDFLPAYQQHGRLCPLLQQALCWCRLRPNDTWMCWKSDEPLNMILLSRDRSSRSSETSSWNLPRVRTTRYRPRLGGHQRQDSQTHKHAPQERSAAVVSLQPSFSPLHILTCNLLRVSRNNVLRVSVATIRSESDELNRVKI